MRAPYISRKIGTIRVCFRAMYSFAPSAKAPGVRAGTPRAEATRRIFLPAPKLYQSRKHTSPCTSFSREK